MAQHSVLPAAIRSVAAARAPACILDTRGAFLFVNEAWERLPPEAGGPAAPGALVGLGFVEQLAPGPLREAFDVAVADALANRGSLPRVIAGEWNDAEQARLLSTRIDPLVGPAGIVGLVLQRTVVRTRPTDEVYGITDRDDAAYRDAAGAVVRCDCCRRVRDLEDPSRWDFVPRLAALPGASPGALCELCAELHLTA